MEGIYGTIKTEQVEEWVLKARKTMVELRQFVTDEDQIQLCKSIWAHLTPNCQTEADFTRLTEIEQLQEMRKLVSTATNGQRQLINRLSGDLSIIGKYANGFIPRVVEPTRKQLLCPAYWVENIDIFADDRD